MKKTETYIQRKSDGKYFGHFDGITYWYDKKEDVFSRPYSKCLQIIEKRLDSRNKYNLIDRQIETEPAI